MAPVNGHNCPFCNVEGTTAVDPSWDNRCFSLLSMKLHHGTSVGGPGGNGIGPGFPPSKKVHLSPFRDSNVSSLEDSEELLW
mmetsp:Transcript_8303/g.24558  ORF Transcript_8303/g.24558 Transcript_8303/m.24558 type:complete len:82 (+) Transcript_8303:1121-1366(+)